MPRASNKPIALRPDAVDLVALNLVEAYLRGRLPNGVTLTDTHVLRVAVRIAADVIAQGLLPPDGPPSAVDSPEVHP